MSWEIDFLLWLQEVIPFKLLFVLITRLGDSGFLAIIIGLYLLLVRKDRKEGFHLFVALMLMAISVNLILKPMVGRIRPFDIYPMSLLIKAPLDYSFPSGHTAGAFAVAYVLGKHYPKIKVLAYFVACLIGFSRMVLFVHYPTDVLGGILVGLACAKIAESIFKF